MVPFSLATLIIRTDESIFFSFFFLIVQNFIYWQNTGILRFFFFCTARSTVFFFFYLLILILVKSDYRYHCRTLNLIRRRVRSIIYANFALFIIVDIFNRFMVFTKRRGTTFLFSFYKCTCFQSFIRFLVCVKTFEVNLPYTIS
ncbi:hypothetical protein PUN28_004482 [Cardiocondyla obscurior]|uniref:Uncharacterized protein n=1 Tax=Cardiocondyla obscurior TaxID=286306 RepID=A0AAW2GH30_9HYME